MTDDSQKASVLQGAPRAELARLCRHICLAREQGTMSPVTAEDEFRFALTTVSATYGPQSINAEDLREVVAIEESRVADAAVIAELLATRLAGTTPATVQSGTTTPSNDAAIPRLPTPIPFPSISTVQPPSIADLIDGMLSQEKRDVRKRSHG